MLLLPLALAASPSNSPFFARIDSPVDGTVIEPTTTPTLELLGRVEAGSAPASGITCNWYFDGVLVVSKPFEQDGRCDASTTTDALAEGAHLAALEAVRSATGQTSRAKATVVIHHGPGLLAHRTVDCTASDGYFTIEGTAYGADRWDQELTLTLENAAGFPETLSDGTDTGLASLVQSVQTLCTTTDPRETCTAPFSFEFQVDHPNAGPWNWRIDMVEIGLRGGSAAAHPMSAEFPVTPLPPDAPPSPPSGHEAYQPLFIIEPPALTFAEILDGVVSDASLGATWSNEDAYAPYGLQVTYTPNRAEETVWRGASFLALDAYGGSTDVTCTRETDGRSVGTPGTAVYACDVPTERLAVQDYAITMLSQGDLCAAPDTFALTIADPAVVDYDRDGSLAQDDQDCDDHDPTRYPDAPDAQCDAIDQDCDEDADDDAGDANEDVESAVDTIEGATLTGATVSGSGESMRASGNLHNEADVDWYEFALDPAEEDGDRNASMTVKLSVPGDDSGPYGSWTVEVEAGSDPASPEPTTNPTLTSTGSPVHSSAGWTYTWTLDGDRSNHAEFAWWLAVRAESFDAHMCDPDGSTTYLLRAFE